MQLEIDFEVYKALTALRQSEADTYSDVLRRLLQLPARTVSLRDVGAVTIRHGVWFGNVHFPEGTQFRATYKGRMVTAEIRDDCWIGEDGMRRKSPSDAASAVSNTNVNGWRFWHARRPGDTEWRRLDELR